MQWCCKDLMKSIKNSDAQLMHPNLKDCFIDQKATKSNDTEIQQLNLQIKNLYNFDSFNSLKPCFMN